MEAVGAVNEDPVCVTCGEYSEDGGYLCDKCQDIAMDALEDERAEALRECQAQCQYHCEGKIHHGTLDSANEHATDLGGDAYPYVCESEHEWWDGDTNSGLHWHVASSPVPRKWREWVEA